MFKLFIISRIVSCGKDKSKMQAHQENAFAKMYFYGISSQKFAFSSQYCYTWRDAQFSIIHSMSSMSISTSPCKT